MLDREMMAVWWSTTAALSGRVGRAVKSNGGDAMQHWQETFHRILHIEPIQYLVNICILA
jgi:hypothetical protein